MSSCLSCRISFCCAASSRSTQSSRSSAARSRAALSDSCTWATESPNRKMSNGSHSPVRTLGIILSVEGAWRLHKKEGAGSRFSAVELLKATEFRRQHNDSQPLAQNLCAYLSIIGETPGKL